MGYGLSSTDFGISTHAETVVARALSGSLVLNPIAAGLAGLSIMFGFCSWFFSSRIMEIVRWVHSSPTHQSLVG